MKQAIKVFLISSIFFVSSFAYSSSNEVVYINEIKKLLGELVPEGERAHTIPSLNFFVNRLCGSLFNEDFRGTYFVMRFIQIFLTKEFSQRKTGRQPEIILIGTCLLASKAFHNRHYKNKELAKTINKIASRRNLYPSKRWSESALNNIEDTLFICLGHEIFAPTYEFFLYHLKVNENEKNQKVKKSLEQGDLKYKKIKPYADKFSERLLEHWDNISPLPEDSD